MLFQVLSLVNHTDFMGENIRKGKNSSPYPKSPENCCRICPLQPKKT